MTRELELKGSVWKFVRLSHVNKGASTSGSSHDSRGSYNSGAILGTGSLSGRDSGTTLGTGSLSGHGSGIALGTGSLSGRNSSM